MKKTSATNANAGTKASANATSATTMKRKEIDEEDVVIVVDSPPSSILPKKGRYKDDSTSSCNNHASTKSLKSSNETPTYSHPQRLPQNQVQFTFGELPGISDGPFKATIIICKRANLQQILSEGNEIFLAMLGLNVSTNILQSMYIDCGGGSGSSSKPVSVASTYVDHVALNMTHHKLYFITVPDKVSRSNHDWSVHSISDAIKGAVGGSSATSCRIICCGTGVAQVMGSLTASMARAFSVFTRKTKKMTENVASSASTATASVPRIHMSFMDLSDSGIHESIPTNNGDHLLYTCESIQLTARLVDMVRDFSVRSK